MDIYYESAAGKRFNLNAWPFMIQNQAELFSGTWEYTADSATGVSGGRITTFGRSIATKSIELEVYAESAHEYASLMSSFHEAYVTDIANLTPGHISVNGYQLSCYITGTDYGEYDENFYAIDMSLKIVSEYPYWTKAVKGVYFKNPELIPVSEFLDYPKGYKHDYTHLHTAIRLSNDHYAPCDFQMLIYGPCKNPAIEIDGAKYEVLTEVSEGGYLVIDSRYSTVKKYEVFGEETNVFNSRNKDSYLFKKIPAGSNLVTWVGSFSFDLTLFQERGEPKWNI